MIILAVGYLVATLGAGDLVAISAVVVSVAGLLVSSYVAASSASSKRMQDVERQLAECLEARKNQERELAAMRAREIEMLREIFRLKEASSG